VFISKYPKCKLKLPKGAEEGTQYEKSDDLSLDPCMPSVCSVPPPFVFIFLFVSSTSSLAGYSKDLHKLQIYYIMSNSAALDEALWGYLQFDYYVVV
jgi:hypothetical protein